MSGGGGNEYEQERLERIARNRAMLASLQVEAAASEMRGSAEVPTDSAERRKRGRPKKDSLSAKPVPDSTPRRRSSRAMAVSTREKLREVAAEELEDEEEKGSSRGAPNRRRKRRAADDHDDVEEYDPQDESSDLGDGEEDMSGSDEEESVGEEEEALAGGGRKPRIDREAEVDEAVARAMRARAASTNCGEISPILADADETELREALALSLEPAVPRDAAAKKKRGPAEPRQRCRVPRKPFRKPIRSGKERDMKLSEEEWTAVFHHISKGCETITTQDLLKISEELGHPAGQLDLPMEGETLVSMLLKRAGELTGSAASYLRLPEFLLLSQHLY